MQRVACVVLHDNTALHDASGVAYMQANGMHHVRLPPYSHNLQRIEGVFSELRAIPTMPAPSHLCATLRHVTETCLFIKKMGPACFRPV